MMDYFALKWSLTSALFVNLLSLVQSDVVGYTSIEPSGTLYRAVGEQLELICSYGAGNMDNSSDSLCIHHCMNQKCSTLPSEPVNSSSIRAFIPSLRGENNHTYTCRFRKNAKTISITYVRVGYRPSTPEDIYCFSRNHCDMNCTVKLAERDTKAHLWLKVTFHFKSTRSTKWLECPNNDPRYNCCYWSPPSGSGEDMDNDFVINRNYTIRATVTNVLGSKQLVRTIEDTRTIVIISELRQFKATSITSRGVLLTWMLPESLLPVTFVIDFVISYTSKWAKQEVWYSDKNNMTTRLIDLIPYTQYNVSIRARSQLVNDERSWSAVSRLSFKTEKDAPDAAPRTTVGGFFIPRRANNLTELRCAIYIFTKPLPPKKRNGEQSDLHYKVFLRGDRTNKYIITPATTISLSDTSCWNKGPYDIILQACNGEYLCSKKRTSMRIPLTNQNSNAEFPSATDVIAEGFGDTRFRVSWTIPRDFDESLVGGVTVFWCRGSREQRICKSNMSWQKIDKAVTSADLKIKHSNYRDWMFAVSYRTHNGESGGMVFEECHFLYEESKSNETTDTAVKPTFHLVTRDDKEGKLVDVVSLSFSYCDAQFLYRKPEQYEFFYKQTQGSTEEDCINGAQSLKVKATLRVQEIVLPDLDPASKYSVCMRIHTSVGTSKLSDVKWRKPLKSPGPFPSIAETVLIIIGSLLGLASVILTLWCFKRKYKALDARIEVPLVDLDYQFTTEKQKTSADSYADSGFNSRGNTTNTTEEKMSHYRRLSDPIAKKSEDRENLLGDNENVLLDLTHQEPGACNCTKTKLKNDDKIHGSGLSDYCQTDKKTETDNSGSLIGAIFKSDCSRVKRISSSDIDIGMENNENISFVEVNDSNIVSMLIPQNTNSAVVVNGHGDNYRPQLDSQPVLRTGNIQTDGFNDSDASLSDLDVGRSFEEIQNMAAHYGEHGRSPNNMKSDRSRSRYHDNPGDSLVQSKGENLKPLPMSHDKRLARSLGSSLSNTYSCQKVDGEELHSLDHSTPRNDTCYDTSILGREPHRMNTVIKSTSQTYKPTTNCQSNVHTSLNIDTCELNYEHSNTCCEPHQHNFGSYREQHKHSSDITCEQHEYPSNINCEQHGDNCASCCKQHKKQFETKIFDDDNSLFEPHNPNESLQSENYGSVRKQTYVARIF